MKKNIPVPTRRPRRKRALVVSIVVVGTLAALLAASAITNSAITNAERANLHPYGQKVSLPAGDINVYRNGGSGPTIVMLSGFGTPAPAVDFAPLIRELDAFNVIVIEGFGYGFSDTDVPNRTVENITFEIHDVLDKLDVDSPVVLLGHSVGGLYTHYYANAYPGEVSAIIGIDPMVATASSLAVGEPSSMEKTLVNLGLMRLVTTIAPDIIQPPGNAYTPLERKLTAALTNWNYGNLSISDEWAQIGANSTKASTKPIPVVIPVIDFIASDTINSDPTWLPKHEAELANVSVHELHILEGAHYLHWTQAPAIGQAINAFLTAHLSN